MTLKDLQIGQAACISKVGGNGELRQHFLDMGIIPGTVITKIKTAPMGDPVEYDVNGYELTMRLEDAGKIDVESVPAEGPSTPLTPSTSSGTTDTTKTAHPGLGEGGRFHTKDDEDPVPEGRLSDADGGKQIGISLDAHFLPHLLQICSDDAVIRSGRPCGHIVHSTALHRRPACAPRIRDRGKRPPGVPPGSSPC